MNAETVVLPYLYSATVVWRLSVSENHRNQVADILRGDAETTAKEELSNLVHACPGLCVCASFNRLNCVRVILNTFQSAGLTAADVEVVSVLKVI